VANQGRPLQVDESHFAEIDAAMLYIEEARARAERAAKTLRAEGADAHLIEALADAQEQLSDVARALRQGTLFAVPSGQISL
jgi:hypothetical protein